MKPELNNETKARFLGNYIGCEVQWYRGDGELITTRLTVSDFPFLRNKNCWLLATPLSQITDEDAVEVAKMYGWEESHLRFKERVFQFKLELNNINQFKSRHSVEVIDYLRSREYALPFMGISVEEMCEAGWVKLREGGEG